MTATILENYDDTVKQEYELREKEHKEIRVSDAHIAEAEKDLIYVKTYFRSTIQR